MGWTTTYDEIWYLSGTEDIPVGFSFILTFIFLLLTILVSLWLGALWYTQSSSDQTGRVFGTFRTALEVAARVREKIGDGVEGMSEREISNAIREESFRPALHSTTAIK